MARTIEDRIEEEVRKRLSEAAAAAGVDRGRISLEVLYLLPPDFVRMYTELFDMALSDPVKPTADGGKDEGRIKAVGKPKDALKARSMGGAAKGGKRFVARSWPVRSEQALDAKNKLDRRIVAHVLSALADARKGRQSELDAIRAGELREIEVKRCPECGVIQSPRWLRCPFH